MIRDSKEYIVNSQEKLNVAKHLLTITYPLFNDPKVFLAVIDNLFLSASYCVSSIMDINGYDPLQKFDDKIQLLKKIKNKYELKNQDIKKIEEIKEIVLAHKLSPVEFSRQGKFVICDNNYSLETLSIDKINQYIDIVECFINKTKEAFEYV